MPRKAIEMTGRVFGFLKVLYEREDSIPKRKKFMVVCISCGKKRAMLGDNIRRHAISNARGCANCYHSSTTHGMYHELWFKTWEGMMARCYNKNHQAYHNYGERGIGVAPEWRDSPAVFGRFLLKNGWEPGLEIDRRDNNKGYSPLNCRIVTSLKNHNNTRFNRRFFVYGESLTISEASRKYKIRYSTIRERLNRGWTGEKSVSVVTHGNGRY